MPKWPNKPELNAKENSLRTKKGTGCTIQCVTPSEFDLEYVLGPGRSLVSPFQTLFSMILRKASVSEPETNHLDGYQERQLSTLILRQAIHLILDQVV